MSAAVMFHPPKHQIQRFVEGELSAGMSVALSAHMEFCADCRRTAGAAEAELVAQWNAKEALQSPADLTGILDAITQQPQERANTPITPVSRKLVVDDQDISLPRVLAQIASAGLNWKTVSNGIRSAKVDLDTDTTCEFIHMQPGSKAPQHSHRGNEVMLVLDGKFSDEMGEYGASDFVIRDPAHRHQPRTETGCICFSVLDSPLVFTEGWLRLWNPIGLALFQLTRWRRRKLI